MAPLSASSRGAHPRAPPARPLPSPFCRAPRMDADPSPSISTKSRDWKETRTHRILHRPMHPPVPHNLPILTRKTRPLPPVRPELLLDHLYPPPLPFRRLLNLQQILRVFASSTRVGNPTTLVSVVLNCYPQVSLCLLILTPTRGAAAFLCTEGVVVVNTGFTGRGIAGRGWFGGTAG